MEENENGGISLGDIFRLIFSQKWLALIITVLITVAGTLGIYLTGKPNADYTVTFSIDLPGANNTDTFYTYPDGSKFYYADYVSANVLNQVKASDAAFNPINIDKMLKNGSVDFDESIDVIQTSVVEDQEVSVINRRTFSISIKTGSFKSYNEARSFLKKLAEYPINFFSQMDVNYNVYLEKSGFDSASSYEQQLNYLQAEINLLNSLCDTLSGITKSLKVESWREDFNKRMETASIGSLLNSTRSNYYLKDPQTSLEKFNDEYEQLRKEKADYEKIIESIINSEDKNKPDASLVVSSSVAATIAPYQEKLTACERRMTEIDGYRARYSDGFKGDEAEREFVGKIQKIYDDLTKENGYIAQLTQLSKEVYGGVANVVFLSPDYIKVENKGMGLITSLLFSLIAGLVLAAIVAFIVGYVKNSKKQSEKSKAAENSAKATDDKAQNE